MRGDFERGAVRAARQTQYTQPHTELGARWHAFPCWATCLPATTHTAPICRFRRGLDETSDVAAIVEHGVQGAGKGDGALHDLSRPNRNAPITRLKFDRVIRQAETSQCEGNQDRAFADAACPSAQSGSGMLAGEEADFWTCLWLSGVTVVQGRRILLSTLAEDESYRGTRAMMHGGRHLDRTSRDEHHAMQEAGINFARVAASGGSHLSATAGPPGESRGA